MDEKRKLKNELFNYLGQFGNNIHTKFSNICGKTGKYNVPIELYQKRTNRKSRVLMPWKDVKTNKFTIEQLSTFEGGVTIEFLNNDFFDESNQKNPVFIELKKRLGGDDVVSSIISFRSESGSSSSALPREAFKKFINGTQVLYKGNLITINENNYKDYAINKTGEGGVGNDKWNGFLFVSIKGGQQDTIETHKRLELTIFNPACEYAASEVCLDIDLVLGYLALKSVDYNILSNDSKFAYDTLIIKLENVLDSIKYDIDKACDSLLEYCLQHISVTVIDDQLTDPIQLKKINIKSFDISDNSGESIDVTHNEAVNKGKYYWDDRRKTILTPARPTNLFWSYHLSNMMQQDYSLDEYFLHEKEIYTLRQKLMNKDK